MCYIVALKSIDWNRHHSPFLLPLTDVHHDEVHPRRSCPFLRVGLGVRPCLCSSGKQVGFRSEKRRRNRPWRSTPRSLETPSACVDCPRPSGRWLPVLKRVSSSHTLSSISTVCFAKHVNDKAARWAKSKRPRKSRPSDINRTAPEYELHSMQKPAEYSVSDAPATPVVKAD